MKCMNRPKCARVSACPITAPNLRNRRVMTRHLDDARVYISTRSLRHTHTVYETHTHPCMCLPPPRVSTRDAGTRGSARARARPRAVRLSTARETNGACDASDDARACAGGWMLGEIKDARARSFARRAVVRARVNERIHHPSARRVGLRVTRTARRASRRRVDARRDAVRRAGGCGCV